MWQNRGNFDRESGVRKVPPKIEQMPAADIIKAIATAGNLDNCGKIAGKYRLRNGKDMKTKKLTPCPQLTALVFK